MNQMTSNLPPEILQQVSGHDDTPGPAPKGPAANAPKPAKPVSGPRLSEADLPLINEYLMSQEDGLARRSDLTELHKRIVKMLQSLSQNMGEGLVKKAAADRAGLTARIDTLEDAVNRMEGALRIEFEPVLRRAMADVVAAQAKPRRRPMRTLAWAGAVLVSGLVLGTVFHDEVLSATKQSVSKLETMLSGINAE